MTTLLLRQTTPLALALLLGAGALAACSSDETEPTSSDAPAVADTSCTLITSSTSEVSQLVCGSKTITLGQGGCSSVLDDDSLETTITCDDGTMAVLSPGSRGADGAPGADGAQGPQGQAGLDGLDGLDAALVSTSERELPVGDATCSAGGLAIEVELEGQDDPIATVYRCHTETADALACVPGYLLVDHGAELGGRCIRGEVMVYQGRVVRHHASTDLGASADPVSVSQAQSGAGFPTECSGFLELPVGVQAPNANTGEMFASASWNLGDQLDYGATLTVGQETWESTSAHLDPSKLSFALTSSRAGGMAPTANIQLQVSSAVAITPAPTMVPVSLTLGISGDAAWPHASLPTSIPGHATLHELALASELVTDATDDQGFFPTHATVTLQDFGSTQTSEIVCQITSIQPAP